MLQSGRGHRARPAAEAAGWRAQARLRGLNAATHVACLPAPASAGARQRATAERLLLQGFRGGAPHPPALTGEVLLLAYQAARSPHPLPPPSPACGRGGQRRLRRRAQRPPSPPPRTAGRGQGEGCTTLTAERLSLTAVIGHQNDIPQAFTNPTSTRASAPAATSCVWPSSVRCWPKCLDAVLRQRNVCHTLCAIDCMLVHRTGIPTKPP
jgi:hypothetical protein